MKNLLTTSNGVAIMLDKQEARVSHRVIAESLGVLPHNAFNQIRTYQSDFEEVGVLLFKTIKPLNGTVGGRPETIAYLNEDQSFLLLSFSKNTTKARAAKLRMVQAFAAARDCIKQRATQYLPMHHAAHDAIGELVSLAHAQGSATAESVYHMCYEKLINAVAGIEAGSRDTLDAHTQAFVTAAYATIDSTVHAANAQGLHYKETFKRVKHSVTQLAAMMIKSLEVAA